MNYLYLWFVVGLFGDIVNIGTHQWISKENRVDFSTCFLLILAGPIGLVSSILVAICHENSLNRFFEEDLCSDYERKKLLSVKERYNLWVSGDLQPTDKDLSDFSTYFHQEVFKTSRL